ncbi:MAG TPA: EI24 domain-containing protein [Arachnia sp.]|nr:EI24 domain-containing protein [Arachnia sp.]HMT87358.1 EI24 domain-containing protein [Arachnia sp.]
MVNEFIGGFATLLRGFGYWSRNPRRMALSAIPAVLVGTVMFGLLIWIGASSYDWATDLTGFASAWAPYLIVALRGVVAGAIVGGAGFLMVISYAAVTLLVGQPFFERVWRDAERDLGGAALAEMSLWTSVRRGIGDGLRLVMVALSTAVVVFLVGLIPGVGAPVAGILGALLAGRMLSIELTSLPGDARGLTLDDRQRLLAGHRARQLGFGVAAYLVFLIPGVAVFGTPAAIVGGTLLIRELRGEACAFRR